MAQKREVSSEKYFVPLDILCDLHLHLADAFIQSDLQMRTMEAIKIMWFMCLKTFWGDCRPWAVFDIYSM